MTDRSFGYTCCPPVPQHYCVPGHITTSDWMQYINAYMDVRARQIYDKLKGQIGTGTGDGQVNFTSREFDNQLSIGKIDGKQINSPDIDVESYVNKSNGVKIATITFGNEDNKYDIYSPEQKEHQIEFENSNNLPNPIKIGNLDGTDIYAPGTDVEVTNVDIKNGQHIATIVVNTMNEQAKKQVKLFAPKQTNEFDFVILKDSSTGKKYKVSIQNGSIVQEEI